MIQSANDYPISTIFNMESNIIYKIPRYQREYSWGKTEWEHLIDDIWDNDRGYYLGSIICINPITDSFVDPELELVDGQQRLLTISILFAALYSYLKNNNVGGDFEFESTSIKRKLVLNDPKQKIRVVPQIQNNNQNDYKALLSSIDIYPNTPFPSYAGNRRLMRAYYYFLDRLNQIEKDNGNSADAVMELIKKLNAATLVKIEVKNHADAYTLFESLNTRGMPLTAIDLIKNKLLARMEKESEGQIDFAFNQWQLLLEYLGDDYYTQERFFRQYYNAYREELKAIVSVPVATRSNLMQIYEKLIDVDVNTFIKRMVKAGQTYSMLLNPEQENVPSDLVKPIKDLDRIQGTPSYLLMIYLLENQDTLQLNSKQLASIIHSLVCFFVRRHLTDLPPTRDLTRIFMEMIQNIDGRIGDELIDYMHNYLVSILSSDDIFRTKLEGPIYRDNLGVTRFILCALAEQSMTAETMTDLWARSGKGNNYIWTIEHIFPQGENIPDSWVQMIADGDRAKAEEIQQEWVHRLGNLTITGFNSTLGNKSFEEKRNRKDRQDRYVGYRNGLSLNDDLLETNTWDKEQIEKRTAKLIEKVLQLYQM